MALFSTNEYKKCTCGCEIFTQVETFRIVTKPIKSTLTETTSTVKEVIGTQLQCTSCGKLMTDPLNK